MKSERRFLDILLHLFGEGRNQTPSFPSRAQKVPQGFGEVVCHSGRQQNPQSLAASRTPHHSLCAAAPSLGDQVTGAPVGEKIKKKKVLKKWKNVASEHRALQSRKQIHNSSNLAPFHTTDGSTADVKCIYGVGTFPVASWGLGKISDLPERNCCLVRDEKFLVFFFHIYNSSFHLP